MIKFIKRKIRETGERMDKNYEEFFEENFGEIIRDAVRSSRF